MAAQNSMIPFPQAFHDEAQDRWQTVVRHLEKEGIAFSFSNELKESIPKALVFSDFVYRQILHHPWLLHDLIESRDIGQPYGPQSHGDRMKLAFEKVLGQWPLPIGEHPLADSKESPVLGADEKATVMSVLRRFRHREMVRIAVRDICGWADLDETLTDLSALAEACLGGALSFIDAAERVRWGCPMDAQGHAQELVVIGLGKLGAGELNFSSDVDLMFAYSRKGETQGGAKGRISNEEYFLRIARELIHMIGHTTAEGFVFRVDTRLRPYGESGPLVMYFDALEDYYQAQGREWERYALIKAKVVAGDREGGRELLERLQPFVFRRYLDYGTFESLRRMKGRIDLEVKSKGLQDNIKLGSGGIREIEFFGQMFQLIRGGVEPALQIRPIRQVLQALVQGGHIDAALQAFLDEAYVFLRTVENRIQQWADQQEHGIPADPQVRARLAASLGYETWASFSQNMVTIRQQVHAHFQELLAPTSETEPSDTQPQLSKRLEGIWLGVIDTDQALPVLQELGFSDPAKVLQQIAALQQDRGIQSLGQVGHERLNRLLPLVLEAVVGTARTEVVLDRIFELIRCIHKRTAYLALMLENPSILRHLVTLTNASPWIAELLCRHPVLLDELLDPRTLYRPPRRQELETELKRRLGAIDADELEYQMETLRVFKQTNLLRVAASDITHVLPLMKVSDRLSDIAESAVTAAATLCWQQLIQKYGAPACQLDDQPCTLGFAIIAYGKLGGLELGYGSDLDLVFLHAAQSGQSTDGERSMDNTTFFARLGQRVLHMLTTHMGAGILYEVDMRLRPSGDSGMLVSHVDGFAAYQRENAWTWEHQALLRARTIYGDPPVLQRFEAIRSEILTQARDGEKLKGEVADMRLRLRQKNPNSESHLFDIKHGLGGILDIEFIVQFLVLKFAHRHPRIIRWTDNVRQLQALNEVGILDQATAFGLRRAYLIYRAMVHRLSLGQQPPTVAADRFLATRHFIQMVWQRYFGAA